jgi:Xaa-Pro aminopeptidase
MSKPPLFHFAESYHDANQFYLSGFLCPDPFAVLEVKPGKVTLGVSSMEEERARKESGNSMVLSLSIGKRRTIVDALVNFLENCGTQAVRVLPSFPFGLARDLMGKGIDMQVDGVSLSARRRKKTKTQILAMEKVQRSCEQAMESVRSVLLECAAHKGFLIYEGRLLTAEKLRAIIEVFLLKRGFEAIDTIVSPGRGGADPHWRGEGPVRVGVPIVVDIFPRSRKSRYHSDMSRTFVVGKASSTVKKMYQVVCEAQDAALGRLKCGVSLPEVHSTVCDLMEKYGFDVPRNSRTPRRGLLHSTGHGLGLDIHEPPSVSAAGDVLKPGDVVTVEPGLYDRRVGGVRIEDVVACMPDGTVKNITRFDRELEII